MARCRLLIESPTPLDALNRPAIRRIAGRYLTAVIGFTLAVMEDQLHYLRKT
jgi:hypothetical protein